MTPREALLELIKVDPNRTYAAHVVHWARVPLFVGNPPRFTEDFYASCQPGISGEPCTVRFSRETMLAAFSELRAAIIRDNARIALALVHPLKG